MNNTTNALNLSETVLIFKIAKIAVSTLGIIASATTVIVIVASKSLRTPCFVLIAGGGIGSFVVAAHYLTISIAKICHQLGAFSFERTGLQCLLLTGTLGIWGIAFHSQLSCLVAIDRLISVVAPIKYRQLGKRYAAIILATCVLVVTIQTVIGFATAALYIKGPCHGFGDIVHPLFVESYADISLFWCVVNVLAYVGMMISFRFRHFFSGGTAQDSFMKQQLAVMPTVKLMAFLYLVTGVVAEILLNICWRLRVESGQPAFLFSVGTTLKDASSMVEGLSLLARSRKFRQCLLVLFGRKPNGVSGTPKTTNGRNHNSVKSTVL